MIERIAAVGGRAAMSRAPVTDPRPTGSPSGDRTGPQQRRKPMSPRTHQLRMFGSLLGTATVVFAILVASDVLAALA